MQETTCHTIPHVQTWGQGPVDLSLENDSTSPCGGGSLQSVYLQQFRQTGHGGPALTCL